MSQRKKVGQIIISRFVAPLSVYTSVQTENWNGIAIELRIIQFTLKNAKKKLYFGRTVDKDVSIISLAL